MKIFAYERLAATDSDVIAPATSFKEKNESDLARRQQQEEKQETENTDNSNTETSSLRAALRILAFSRTKASSTIDGDFPAGQSFPSRIVTEDPATNDYLNTTACEDVLADADPHIFNLAEQPLP